MAHYFLLLLPIMLAQHILHLLHKEFTGEFRQRHALNGILLYVISTVFISYLSFKGHLAPATWNALFWIILVFAAVNASSKSFMLETRGKMLYYYTLVSPQALILAKMLYNSLLLLVLSFICLLFYGLFIGFPVSNTGLFMLALSLGSVGFSCILTMVSAIAAKTHNNFTLMAILSFPLLVPMLLVLIKLSKNAIDGLAWSVNLKYVLVLAALNLIVFILSYLLFPYLWRD